MLSNRPQEYELMPTASRLSISSLPQTWSQRHLRGWRFGILSGATLAFTVLCVNLAFTIYGGIDSRSEDTAGQLLYSGNCDEVTRVNLAIHIFINVLSTLLLSASNYGMQCLSAPTRKEIDAAHAKKTWLDIGVLSVKNLSKISRRRTFLWALLGLSSFPLHLFYNSAVYSSIYAYGFGIYLTTEAVLQSPTPQLFVKQFNYSFSDDYVSSYMWASYHANNLTRLENADCMKAYALTFQTAHGNLILVASNASSTPYITAGDDFVESGCTPDPFGWMCGRQNSGSVCDGKPACSTTSLDPNNWAPFGSPIQYCLSEQVEQKCEIQFVPFIAYGVIAFNCLKAGILLYTFFLIKEDPLMTVGDAISSFLRRKDESTAGLCLMSKADIAWWKTSNRAARPLKIAPKKWGVVVSKRRWFIIISLYLLVLGVCIFLFAYGLVASGFPASALMRLGIGAVDARTFIGWSLPREGASGLMVNVFVANSPQPILSMIYYTYNGLLTCFLLAVEWNGFARSRKGLRVTTSRHGLQRSSYTLQLPRKWAIPLMGLSALLHWLCSQSIFLVSIKMADERGGDLSVSQTITCAYSPVAIICTISVGLAMLGFAIVTSRRAFRSPEMPVVGSCSAAISACCHLPVEQPPSGTAATASPYGNPYASPYSHPAGYTHPDLGYLTPDGRYAPIDPFASSSGFGAYGETESERLLDGGAPMGSARRSVYSMHSYESGYDSAYVGPEAREGPEVGAEACQMKIKWGVIEDDAASSGYMGGNGASIKRRVRHCGFSSRQVEQPVEGEFYAG